MRFRRLSPGIVVAILLTAPGRVAADDPRRNVPFEPTLYPPGGFSVKKAKPTARYDAKNPKNPSLVAADGKLSAWGQWYYTLGSDPKAFKAWWDRYWSDADNWKPGTSPVYDEAGPVNQGHRILGYVGQVHRLINSDPDLDPAVKAAFTNDAWKEAVEKTIGDTIDARGWLRVGKNEAPMAMIFHLLRTQFRAMQLRPERIYTLERAQNCIATLLTEPWVVNSEDRWLPGSPDYFRELTGNLKLDRQRDSVPLVKDGKVLYTGGLFIGWKTSLPSLHGTWDGLAIINILFQFYPDPDPASPKSIFHKWHRLPEEKKKVGKDVMVLLARRLWLDWRENKGPTYCWVTDGKPTDDRTRPSEAEQLLDHAGYEAQSMTGWAKACWDEMFGDPKRNTNDGVQAFLAIAHGRVMKDLKLKKLP